MNNKPIADELIQHHRDTLKNLWDAAMRWLAVSRGESTRSLTPQERQSARQRAEDYYNRVMRETEVILYYLRSNGDIEITGPEERDLKRREAGHDVRL